jgi:putative permease
VIKVLKGWGNRYFSDPQAILLTVLLGGSVLLLMWMGKILAPVVASIIIAYLLQWIVNVLRKWKVPQFPAVLIAYGAFLGIFLCAIFVLWPLIWQQILRLFEELPTMIQTVQHFLYLLPEKFPEFITQATVDNALVTFSAQLKNTGRVILTASLASLPSIIAAIIYLVLVPLMVFFFLKDNHKIGKWFASFLPKDRRMLTTVWHEVDEQIGNYVRGKAAEVFIVGVITYGIFYFFHLRYAVLLAVLVGLSVLIPYIGIMVVTIPVVFVALFQWGFSPELAYLLIVYGVVQALDGAVLVPLLFSEAVNLHPLAIIVAVLVFGGWWGFWGVFFAIPLAVLVKATIAAWPKDTVKQ